MSFPILNVALRLEEDVVLARQRTREITKSLGFDTQQQTRVATAVSEIARNAIRYAGGGEVHFWLEGQTRPQLLMVRITDKGPGIPNPEQILSGGYKSHSGLGLGLLGTQRLMDRLVIETRPGHTTVTAGKLLPREAPLFTQATLPKLPPSPAVDLLEEFRGQNRELLVLLDELRVRQADLVRLNRELEDTNRGVVALYSELEEKADSLRRADDVKSRFLSNMSHEFRTPLNSMLALSRMLLDRSDGPLNPEQEKQVGFIRKSAENLSELVNDLLDLARVEAGKSVIRKTEFDAGNLFAALRGMLRPLLLTSSVALIFEEPAKDFPSLYTDEGKVSQILRNFISNALKFTERGEIRVAAHYRHDSDQVTFSVCDTGIGIDEQDQAAIFEEFTQIENAIQKRVKGSGLGLPLSRSLAELLGGSVSVESKIGEGSTFSVHLPRVLGAVPAKEPEVNLPSQPNLQPVLVVEDDAETRMIYQNHLRGSQFQFLGARTTREARNLLLTVPPVAILLDLVLESEDTWQLLAQLKSDSATASIPVVVVTNVPDQAKVLALGADYFVQKPIVREHLLSLLHTACGNVAPRKLMLVNADETERYILKQRAVSSGSQVLETGSSTAALGLARRELPDLIILEVAMPGIPSTEILYRLKSDHLTAQLRVAIIASRALTGTEAELFRSYAVPVFSPSDYDGLFAHWSQLTNGVAH